MRFGGINLVNDAWLNNTWSEVLALGAYAIADILPHQGFHENQITLKYQEHENRFYFYLILFAATMLSAQKPVELPLWPNGAPNNNELTRFRTEP